LAGSDRRQLLSRLPTIVQPSELAQLQQRVAQIHISDALLDYCLDIISHTRTSPLYRYGLSPRAGLAVLQCGRAWAMLEGRKQVLPEDLQAIIPAAIGHRLQPQAEAEDSAHQGLVQTLLEAVPIP
jgi:MoxR-like ATPase